MDWKNFAESKKEYPEKIVENTIEGFSKATKGLVELSIVPIGEITAAFSKILGAFQFNLILHSPYESGYRLKLLTIGYDVELMPVYIWIDNGIYTEIFDKKQLENYVTIKNEKDFKDILEKIFSSKKFESIVSGLMKIAEKNKMPRSKK